MKIKGKDLRPPEPVEVKFVRENDEFTFKVGPILDRSEYAKHFPEPKPPKRKTSVDDPGTPIFDDPDYMKKLQEWHENGLNWLFLQSIIQYTEGIEFDQLKPEDPTTWHLFTQELEKSGLMVTEVEHLCKQIMLVNRLTASAVEMAHQDFLLRQAMSPQDL